MASSVLLSWKSSSDGALNQLIIGGSIVVASFNSGVVFYTVPAGKRLILKGRIKVRAVAANTFTLIETDTSDTPAETTFVFGPNAKLQVNGSTGGAAVSGFFEDDV